MIFAEFVNGDDTFLLRIDHIIVIKGRKDATIITYNNVELPTTMTPQEILAVVQKAALNSRNSASGITIPSGNLNR